MLLTQLLLSAMPALGHAQDPKLAGTVPAPEGMTKWPRGLPLDNTPMHFHTSFNNGATGITIMWETDSATTTDVCKYGTSATALSSTATGFQRTYGNNDFTGVYSHIVNINNLSPFTKYYYSCGDPNIAMSETFNVMTARAAGDPTPFTFALIGDAGIKKSDGVFTDMGESMDTFEWVLDVGDLGYADDYYLYFPPTSYEQVYAQWMTEIEPVTAYRGFMGMPGNHESSCNEVTPWHCPSYQQNFTEYRTRWYFPGDENTAYQNMWYSFDYGMVHYLNIDTETDYPDAPGDGYLHAGPFAPSGAQLSWLEADLKAAVANRDKVPWIIVSGHRPIFSASGTHTQQANAFLNLLTTYQVDFYLSGHEHLYERFFPLDKTGKACATNYYSSTGCVTYIVSGDGGNQEGNSQVPSGEHPNMAASCDSEFGWNRVTVFNATTTYWEFIAETSTGPKTIDTAWIYKQYDSFSEKKAAFK